MKFYGFYEIYDFDTLPASCTATRNFTSGKSHLYVLARAARASRGFKMFLSLVSILTRNIDIANLSVRPSVRNVPVSDENGLTYFHRFFTVR